MKVVNLVTARYEVPLLNLGRLFGAGVRPLVPLWLPLLVVGWVLDLPRAYGRVVQLRGVPWAARVAVVMFSLRLRLRHLVLLLVGRLPPMGEARPPLPLLAAVAAGLRATGRLPLLARLVAAWLGPSVEKPPLRAQRQLAALLGVLTLGVLLPVVRRLSDVAAPSVPLLRLPWLLPATPVVFLLPLGPVLLVAPLAVGRGPREEVW